MLDAHTRSHSAIAALPGRLAAFALACLVVACGGPIEPGPAEPDPQAPAGPGGGAGGGGRPRPADVEGAGGVSGRGGGPGPGPSGTGGAAGAPTTQGPGGGAGAGGRGGSFGGADASATAAPDAGAADAAPALARDTGPAFASDARAQAGNDVGAAPGPMGAPAGATPAAAYLDLTHWKLQLPGPKDIQPAELATHVSKYFHGDPVTRRAVFWLDAAERGSTPNSNYVRSELREQLDPGRDRPNWPTTGSHVLSARLRLKSSTADPDKVTVLQIHGYGDGAPPLLKVAVQSGVLYALVKTSNDGKGEDKVLLGRVGNDPFDCEIRVQDRKLSVSLNGKLPEGAGGRDISFWTHDNYFKAGAYPQATRGVVVVEFERLVLMHGK